ncbi:hypothetical protein [Streptomyces sp. XH2]|uniref:hypothetical protein n=1 Tax=Streptomyces sp. XH2 TaxID=3412483 RepID=UPI003C7B10AF
MPQARTAITVAGRHEAGPQGPHLVLEEPLRGHDTFLTGTLLLDVPDAGEVQVRILTFDDITVLAPTDLATLPDDLGDRWSGTLRLPHGWRPPALPEDLARAAAEAGVDPAQWDAAHTRHALTYLSEARDPHVRAERIRLIVAASKGAS